MLFSGGQRGGTRADSEDAYDFDYERDVISAPNKHKTQRSQFIEESADDHDGIPVFSPVNERVVDRMKNLATGKLAMAPDEESAMDKAKKMLDRYSNRSAAAAPSRNARRSSHFDEDDISISGGNSGDGSGDGEEEEDDGPSLTKARMMSSKSSAALLKNPTATASGTSTMTTSKVVHAPMMRRFSDESTSYSRGRRQVDDDDTVDADNDTREGEEEEEERYSDEDFVGEEYESVAQDEEEEPIAASRVSEVEESRRSVPLEREASYSQNYEDDVEEIESEEHMPPISKPTVYSFADLSARAGWETTVPIQTPPAPASVPIEKKPVEAIDQQLKPTLKKPTQPHHAEPASSAAKRSLSPSITQQQQQLQQLRQEQQPAVPVKTDAPGPTTIINNGPISALPLSHAPQPSDNAGSYLSVTSHGPPTSAPLPPLTTTAPINAYPPSTLVSQARDALPIAPQPELTAPPPLTQQAPIFPHQYPMPPASHPQSAIPPHAPYPYAAPPPPVPQLAPPLSPYYPPYYPTAPYQIAPSPMAPPYAYPPWPYGPYPSYPYPPTFDPYAAARPPVDQNDALIMDLVKEMNKIQEEAQWAKEKLAKALLLLRDSDRKSMQSPGSKESAPEASVLSGEPMKREEDPERVSLSFSGESGMDYVHAEQLPIKSKTSPARHLRSRRSRNQDKRKSENLLSLLLTQIGTNASQEDVLELFEDVNAPPRGDKVQRLMRSFLTSQYLVKSRIESLKEKMRSLQMENAKLEVDDASSSLLSTSIDSIQRGMHERRHAKDQRLFQLLRDFHPELSAAEVEDIIRQYRI